MANHVKGRAVLIEVEKSDGVFVPVAGQRDGSLSRTVSEMDVSSKDMDAKEIELTHLEWSVECGGLYKLTDEGFELLEDAFNNKQAVKVRFAMTDFNYVGMAYITELSLEAGYEDAVSYSCSLTGSGELTKEEKTQA